MSSPDWIPITYKAFYDVPRTLFIEHAGGLYFFDCRFDEVVDDYSDEYVVYKLDLPKEALLDADVDWLKFSESGQRIASIKVADVIFDDSRRKAIAATVLRNPWHLTPADLDV